MKLRYRLFEVEPPGDNSQGSYSGVLDTTDENFESFDELPSGDEVLKVVGDDPASLAAFVLGELNSKSIGVELIRSIWSLKGLELQISQLEGAMKKQ